ncbi:MAG: alpha/beta hydrolase, partial [Clostridia bacterium]|nr:alpha/beta hydrolase [Clostridia bacterium]
GRSFRLVPDKTLTHIERFEQYVEDFEDVLDATEDMIRPYYLFAHSMGGAVAAMYLEKGGDVFEKAVLSSPMIAPARGGLPLFVPKLICRTAILFGKKKKRIYVAKPYPGKEEFETSCSTCVERFSYYEKIKRETEDFQNYSPTYAWLLESLKVTKKLLAKDAPKRIKIPILMIAAGQDGAVLPEPQIQFASAAENCERCVIPEAKHEIFLSEDDTVKNYYTMICNFFAQ